MKVRSLASWKPPWAFVAVAVLAAVIQFNPAWRSVMLYDRTAIAGGQWWRLWSGHLVHFGWPHFVADAGLFLILGNLLGATRPKLARVALFWLPPAISIAVFVFDPAMLRYGGLSAVDLSLLLVVAGRGWQHDWSDWFWPAVLLLYVGEILLEMTVRQGHGGGLIRFDDPAIHVATTAHIAAAVCALPFLVGGSSQGRRRSVRGSQEPPHSAQG